jgi:hypothetical protein
MSLDFARLRVVFTAVLAATLARQMPAVAGNSQVVAVTGQQAPGFSTGVTYANFLGGNTTNLPITNSAGTTVYWASLSQPNVYGIWSYNSGLPSLLYKTGDQAPGTTVIFAGIYPDVAVNSSGQFAFGATLAGSGVDSTNSGGVWSNAGGSLALVARKGDHAPGTPSNAYFQFFGVGDDANNLVFNDSGKVAFNTQTFGNVDTVFDRGIWSNVDGSLALIAHAGFAAPGTGVNFGDLASSRLSFNAAGQIVFYATLNGVTVSPGTDTGLWEYRNGSLNLIAREGNHAPGMPDGTNFGDFGTYGFSNPALNSLGRIAFSTVDGNGIWSDAGGPLALVVAAGQSAPGASGTTFSYLRAPVLNHASLIAFRAQIGGSGVSTSKDTGIWSQGSGSLSLVAREGDRAPGTAAGIVFGDFFDPAFSEDMNSAGRVAFSVNATGPGFNGNGIWAQNPAGTLTLIGFTGDQVQVAPGVFRTVSGFEFGSGSGNEDGGRSGFNDAGQVTFVAFFTDGSRALMISNAAEFVPEPSSLMLLAVGGLAVGGAAIRTGNGRNP